MTVRVWTARKPAGRVRWTGPFMSITLNGVLHVKPTYRDSPAKMVRCWPNHRDYSMRWLDLQPEEPAVTMPLADWLLLAGIAAALALSSLV